MQNKGGVNGKHDQQYISGQKNPSRHDSACDRPASGCGLHLCAYDEEKLGYAGFVQSESQQDHRGKILGLYDRAVPKTNAGACGGKSGARRSDLPRIRAWSMRRGVCCRGDLQQPRAIRPEDRAAARPEKGWGAEYSGPLFRADGPDGSRNRGRA